MKFNVWHPLLAFLGSLTLFAGCSGPSEQLLRYRQWMDSPKGIRVLCTTEMVQALVEVVGGSDVDALALIYGELDPHSYQLVKGDNEKIAKAQIIFCNGLDLEHGPSLRASLQNHPRTFYLGDELALKNPESIIRHDGTPDPHIWLDVDLFAKLCPLIAEHLAVIDPPHAEQYNIRAASAQRELENLHSDLLKGFHALQPEHRYLVSSHEAFFYSARAYLATPEEIASGGDLWKSRFCAPEGLAPESQISLRRIMEIIQLIKKQGVKSAFLEINVNSDAIYKIQQVLHAQGYELEIPPQPLYSDSMPPLGQQPTAYQRYIHMIRSNASVILNSWEKAYGQE